MELVQWRTEEGDSTRVIIEYVLIPPQEEHQM